VFCCKKTLEHLLTPQELTTQEPLLCVLSQNAQLTFVCLSLFVFPDTFPFSLSLHQPWVALSKHRASLCTLLAEARSQECRTVENNPDTLTPSNILPATTRSLVATAPAQWPCGKFASTRKAPTCLFASYPSNAWYVKLPKISRGISAFNRLLSLRSKNPVRPTWFLSSRTLTSWPCTPSALPSCPEISVWPCASVEKTNPHVCRRRRNKKTVGSPRHSAGAVNYQLTQLKKSLLAQASLSSTDHTVGRHKPSHLSLACVEINSAGISVATANSLLAAQETWRVSCPTISVGVKKKLVENMNHFLLCHLARVSPRGFFSFLGASH
jgi:hypothetical protein